jgi:hypothetical protein
MGEHGRRFRIVATALLALFAGSVVAGCSTYTDRMQTASLAASAGDYPAAITSLNQVLGVPDATTLPSEWKGDRTLAALERGVLQQSLGRWQDASRDLSAAEKEVELIEYTRDPVGSLAGYIYSDSAKPYAAMATERLALNPVNLQNYLARGDLQGAAVEARRFQTTREFMETEKIGDHGVAPLGAYLAGYVFEALGEGDRALRYYDEALAAGSLESLRRPAGQLAARFPYRGRNLGKFLAGHKAPAADAQSGELLVVLNLGRVPHKVPERMAVGAAIGVIGALATDDIRWLSRSAAKVIVYPKLVDTPSRIGAASVRVGGSPLTLDPLVDLGAAVRGDYKDLEPMIIAAALTRLAARAAVAEGVRAAGNQSSGGLGDVLALVVEGAAVAADRPDTRSWTMMPGKVFVGRVALPAGTHEVEIAFSGVAAANRTLTIDMPAGGYRAVVITEPR